jgi:2-oxo-4-hydroxy-4-carboxy--5-ureidoimidazoline (OHCU) decarboxylase
MTSLPAITTLSHLPDASLTAVLDLLFEPSPALHALTLPVLRSTSFPDYDTLIVAVNAQLLALAASDQPDHVETLNHILGSHPRLGEKKVDSTQSRAEQAQLHQSDDTEEVDQLAALNREYEAAFPGLRYVYVFPHA